MSVNYQSGDVDAHGAAIRAQAMAHKGTAIMNHTEKRTKLHDTRAANLRAATDATARMLRARQTALSGPTFQVQRGIA